MRLFVKIMIPLLFLLLLTGGRAFSQEADQEQLADSLRVIVRMDRVHFSSDDPVELHISVTNTSASRVSFTLYETHDDQVTYTSFQPIITDMEGRRPESIVPYDMEGRQDEQEIKNLFPRQVELHPGETFSTCMDMRRIYILHQGTRYRLRGFFIPSFPKNEIIQSENEIVFRMTDEAPRVPVAKAAITVRTLTPTETVILLLESEKAAKWDRMMNFIDIDRYIYSYPEFGREYQQADFFHRAEVRERFKKFISLDRTDYIIQYSMVQELTESNRDTAMVDVVVERKDAGRTFRYQYRYTLRGDKTRWLVTGVDATVIKGAKK